MRGLLWTVLDLLPDSVLIRALTDKAYWIRVMFRALGVPEDEGLVGGYLWALRDLAVGDVRDGVIWVLSDSSWREWRIPPPPEAIYESSKWGDALGWDALGRLFGSPEAQLGGRRIGRGVDV